MHEVSRWSRRLRLLVGGCVVAIGIGCLPLRSYAEPLARRDVPEPLLPWIDWALSGAGDFACALVQGKVDTRLCSYPARLELDLGDLSGRFRSELRVSRAEYARLPGDASLWPQDVLVDGKPAVVIARELAPAVWLEPGRHVVTGSFSYSALPEGLAIPPETGLLEVRVNGAELVRPRRDANGRVWLQAKSETDTAESRLDVIVSRRVDDSVPLELETRIDLRVSGSAREVALGPVLPAGLVAYALESALPARLESDGRLRVQVRPGDWLVTLRARSLGPVESLAPPKTEGPWAEAEVWAFEAEPSLRIVEVEGVPAVDPQQTMLPGEWRSLPAYVLAPGSVMTFVEKRRGDADPAPDELALERTLWLDFSGGGYTFHDRVSGRLSRSWRLDMAPPSLLGRVSVDGIDQLIGRVSEPSPAGVELRQSALAVEADGRIDGLTREIPAVGWDQDFARVGATLNLPPGWRLFYATGVDSASDTWIRSWSLLDLFLVLVIALSIMRLRGRAWGAVALIALALIWPEAGAPRYAWLFLLAAFALVRVLPEGRARVLASGARLAAIVLVVALAVPFAISQVRSAMYPALEPIYDQRSLDAPLAMPPMPSSMSGLGAEGHDAAMELEQESRADAPTAKLRRKSAQSYYAPEPGALVSTGPGLPSWSWRSVELAWSGPVDRTQTLRLWLIPPWVNFLLGWLRVALLIALLVAAADFDDRFGVWFRGRRAGAALLALFAGLMIPMSSARADEFPPKELLETLRSRMLETPACAPECAEVQRMRLEIDAVRLVARLEIAAAAHTAIPLPGGASDWSPEQVSLNGAPASGLARDGDGTLWLELEPGLHQVVLEGALPERETVELPLPLQPHRVTVTISGWVLHGLHDDGRADASLQLSRVARVTGGTAQALEPGELPPFVRVERDLSLGIVWQVETRVMRASPSGKALFLEVPLLAGESVTSASVRVANGRAQVSLAPDADSVSFSSALAQSDTLELKAPESNLWTEVWRLDASPIWHVDAGGIPSLHAQQAGPLRQREWRPWPNETVSLAIARPAAVAGPTLTLDHAGLRVQPGLRATDAWLTLSVRASRGAQHQVELPEGAELQSVQIDGQTQPIRQIERKVVLPIRPGAHTAVLAWRLPSGIATLYRLPQIGVGAPVVNIDLELAVPAGRWLLALGGPRLGPAVLFWSLLAVGLLVALALGRIPLTPLRATSWLLLFVGLTQVPIWLAIAIAGWLLALGWRRAHPPENDIAFNLLQTALVALTVLALCGLVFAIQQGLLGSPDMQIRGNGSTRELLRWYQDRSGAELPSSWALSVPLLVYRLAMLAWALWLAHALLGWLRFGWESFGTGGSWRRDALTRRPAPPRA